MTVLLFKQLRPAFSAGFISRCAAVLKPLRLAGGVVLLGAAALVRAALPMPVAQALTEADIPDTAVALIVQRVTEPEPVISHRVDVPMNPASVMKLLTTYAGLEVLGPAYTWKTDALVDGPLAKGRLRGNLYIRGSGDPKLTIEQFWLFLKRVRSAGVREIAGDVILDTSFFAPQTYNLAEFDDKPHRAYNAAPSALLINYNAININLAVDETGNKVRAWVEPAFAALTLVNRVAPDSGYCGDWKERLQLKVDGDGRARRIELLGKFSADCGEKNYPLSFFGHQDFARGLFVDLWREMSGKVSGEIRAGIAPVSAMAVARMESAPLSEVIRDINKWSNNVMARQLYLTLGTAAAGPPATAEKSLVAINDWLAAKGMRFAELTLENGSGLSRRERISAKHLADLLQMAWESPLMPEFIASLPIAALDGTMKKRLNDGQLAGQARIKTGTLDGVKALAGYVRDKNGRMVILVCVVNHPRAGAAQAAEDALVRWAYDPAR